MNAPRRNLVNEEALAHWGGVGWGGGLLSKIKRKHDVTSHLFHISHDRPNGKTSRHRDVDTTYRFTRLRFTMTNVTRIWHRIRQNCKGNRQIHNLGLVSIIQEYCSTGRSFTLDARNVTQ